MVESRLNYQSDGVYLYCHSNKKVPYHFANVKFIIKTVDISSHCKNDKMFNNKNKHTG